VQTQLARARSGNEEDTDYTRLQTRLTLFLVDKSGFDLPTLRRSQREALAVEHNSDILVLRRKQIIDLIKYRSLVFSAICLVGSAHCKIEEVIVNLGKAAANIAVFQTLSHTEDFSDLLTFIRQTGWRS
jgi:hypothetical protein